MKEIYKPIPNYEGLYEVSNLGNVKSLNRKSENGRNIKERVMSSNKNSVGYYSVTLRKDGKSNTPNIHQLVAIAFLNHKPNKGVEVVDHINNDKSDNSLINLQIVSHRCNSSKDKSNCSSGFTGVYWNKFAKKWKSSIYINKKLLHLGYFETEEEASLAYKNKLQTLNN